MGYYVAPDEKCRNYLGITYTEDCPYGELLDVFANLEMPCAVSCVHDKDTFTSGDIKRFVASHTDEETGEVDVESLANGMPKEGQNKKSHVHWLVRSPGPITPGALAEKINQLHEGLVNPARLQKCMSPDASLRYFAHLDNPEKAQYGALSVKGFGGIDMSALLKTSKTTNIETLLDVMDYVQKQKLRHYNQLVHWAFSTADLDTINCVTGRASFFASYFRACSDERAEKRAKKKRQEELGY